MLVYDYETQIKDRWLPVESISYNEFGTVSSVECAGDRTLYNGPFVFRLLEGQNEDVEERVKEEIVDKFRKFIFEGSD